jgi:hypothetical protein
MTKYYEVAFYGEIQKGVQMEQVKKSVATLLKTDPSNIENLFSGNRMVIRKCQSYSDAKKLLGLFEKMGAKVNIESVREDTISDGANSSDPKVSISRLTGAHNLLTGRQGILLGSILLIIIIGMSFFAGKEYSKHQNQQNVTNTYPSTVEQQQSLKLSKPDSTDEINQKDIKSEQSKDIEEAIADVEKQIRETEIEDQKYSGGLVKALIGSRLATLKQTHAMLQQRAKAWFFGIGMTYTIDGKVFDLPESAAILLTDVERELEDLQTKVAAAETEASRYGGGLVHAVSLSTTATLKQTQAMLEQKRLALKYGLPQYLGFANASMPSTALNPAPASVSNDTPAREARQWRIVEISSKVTESNKSWWRYAWRLTLANDSQKPMIFNATIEFQDADGFVIDQDFESSLVVPSATEETFTGFALVRVPGAERVQKTLAKVGLH